jgi:N-acetyl-anhydromuramyl-L-alanine amidase AmpD
VDIVDHRLVNTPGDGVELEQREGRPSPFGFAPRIAVIHFGVTDSLDQLWRAQKYREFFAHVSLDGWSEHGDEGPVRSVCKVIQALRFDQRGAHAGASAWGGVANVNGFGFGIEISNPGPLVEKKGDLFTVYGKRWPRAEAVKRKHKIPGVGYNYWATYTDEEIDLCVQIVGLWRQHYGITNVIGHDDCAIPRGRKIDPGPAFPIEYVRKAVFGEQPA